MTDMEPARFWRDQVDEMSIEIDILNGVSLWPRAEPLMQAVWPRKAIGKIAVKIRSNGPRPICAC